MYQSKKVYIQHYCDKKQQKQPDIVFKSQYVFASGFINKNGPCTEKSCSFLVSTCIYTKYIYIHWSCTSNFFNKL